MESRSNSPRGNNVGYHLLRATKVITSTFLLLLFAICVRPPVLQGAQSEKAQDQIEAGRKYFAGSCSNSYCHGSAGSGGGGPKLKDRDFSTEYLTRVINEGIPGTAMPSFKKTYNKDQIEQIIVYVLSLSPNNRNAKAKSDNQAPTPDQDLSKATPKAAVENKPKPSEPSEASNTSTAIPGGSSDMRGDALAGRELFFDTAQIQNCRVCHTIQGIGGKVGPDLSGIAGKPAREIFESIVAPDKSVAERFAMIEITTRDGSRFAGVKRDENETTIRLYDTSILPPVSRAFLKADVTKIGKINTAAMPGDYGTKYSPKQLLDLVSFLKTTDLTKPVSISMKELH